MSFSGTLPGVGVQLERIANALERIATAQEHCTKQDGTQERMVAFSERQLREAEMLARARPMNDTSQTS